ncbi:N-acetylglucosamine-6-phosphate deacetylase [Pedococcus sp. 5OH_020]|uniref:N-acetylglucosamine-6-phosphate deacetylase n=1 Tax=Pedococcus sp. 5OH_020 TaxID=2989814 RepID=UPI0022E9AA4B|nr:amidohydrolase family protein [Pedococcus sp. 5OH_020]
MTTDPAPDHGQLLTGRVLTPGRLVPDGAVAVAGGRIAWVGELRSIPAQWAQAPAPPDWRSGLTLLPGLVDVHCHGGGGAEFGADPGAAFVAAGHHHRAGSTSVVASLVSAPPSELVASTRVLATAVACGELAGIHLEGPFLSTARCGAQDPATLTDLDRDLLDRVFEAAPQAFAQMTFAPERGGGAEVPALLATGGALGAIGHTDAEYATVAAALEAIAGAGARGARPLATHLFNGMPPMHHRAPGPVAAALAAAARGDAVVEVIADGVHLDGGTVRMVFDAVGGGQVALVSDAMAASGLPSGDYTLGGRAVQVRGREARLLDGGSLAGGVSTLLDQVRWCVQELGLDLREVVTAATRTPARALALEGVGELALGMQADVLVVDEQLALQAVMRRGAWL